MRRKDREILDIQEIEGIIRRCQVCRVAFAAGDTPYIVPMSYGYERQGECFTLFFHCAGSGRKLDMMAQNPRVCFEMDGECRLVPGLDGHPEQCTMAYESVVGWGTARLVTDVGAKKHALGRLMVHYGEAGHGDYPEAALRAVTVFEVAVTECTGKRHAAGKTGA